MYMDPAGRRGTGLYYPRFVTQPACLGSTQLLPSCCPVLACLTLWYANVLGDAPTLAQRDAVDYGERVKHLVGPLHLVP
jgi:hypothetical protein